jgi:hypothetical protein
MTVGIVQYTEYGTALHDAIANSGNRAWCENGIWYADDAVTVQVIIDSYDPLPLIKSDKCLLVDAHLASIINAPYTYNGHAYQINMQSQINIAGMATAAGYSVGDPVTFPWRSDFSWIDANNVKVPMTAQEMKVFGYEIGHYVSGCIQYARTLKDSILAATTPATVSAVNITDGWPEE